ncbi:hypothetical protein [Sphingobium boeckii]|uniref:Lipoprotein n=1 Tax=Sphingobium boeckii TaxID=1082345 RepID=A0A7W9EE01_9SPHN|nr:hypothetical protein [Sphingobium boeckii]MBB5684171.1 hypothetical protein [Sphingobium boeckii]
MKAVLFTLSTALLLAGCGSNGPRPQAAARAPDPIVPRKVSRGGAQDAVIGRDARALTGLFGRPAQDVREANGRKLQFGNGVCVLDAYLYARKSGAEPVVTYVDTRKPDGADVDRASCVAALAR